MKTPYNRYTDYIKRVYNERIQKITIDAGFSCPNRDGTVGTGGCTYCNNQSFSPTHIRDLSITDQINHGMLAMRRRYKSKRFFVYFQAFSNTHAPIDKLKKMYEEALNHESVIGLCIGTRPDCVDEEKIDYLETLAKEYDITIEYGLESISDLTLEKINRGHDYQTFLNAIHLTQNRGIKICAHIILGFPWENRELWLESSQKISDLPINFLKIHHLHIVKGTRLGEEFIKNPFKTLSMEEYLEAVIEFLEYLNPEIVIQRLCGEAPPSLLLSSSWKLPASEFLNLLSDEMIKRNTYQGRLYQKSI